MFGLLQGQHDAFTFADLPVENRGDHDGTRSGPSEAGCAPLRRPHYPLVGYEFLRYNVVPTAGSGHVDGVVSNTLQTNWRFAGTLAYAVAPQHGISVTVLSGVTTRIGADFNSLGFAYQYLW